MEYNNEELIKKLKNKNSDVCLKTIREVKSILNKKNEYVFVR